MTHPPETPPTVQFGWEEWVALPDLGVPALRAKVDTGARTSALHAFDIETFGSQTRPKVRFTVHPIPGRDDLVIPCSAPIVDRREVASSNGEKEMRFVIESTLCVGGQSWPIEITLTNRETMSSRMLLGRQALKDHISIVATDRFLQPELSYDVYHTARMREAQPRRALRICVLSREDNYSTRRLVEEGEKRGHTVEVIDTTRCYMAINSLAPEVHYDGKRLPRYDAVIPASVPRSPHMAPPSSASSRPSAPIASTAPPGSPPAATSSTPIRSWRARGSACPTPPLPALRATPPTSSPWWAPRR